jgi:fructokinase
MTGKLSMQGMVSKHIISFGEVLWDLLPSGPVLGGASLNFAARAQALGNTVTLISSVGQDALGANAVDAISELELSADLIVVDENHPTGTVPVEFVDGQPRYSITRDVAFDHIPLLKPILDEVLNADCIYFGTLIQRSPESRKTLHALLKSAPRNTVRFADLNLRSDCYSYETIRWCVENVNCLKFSIEEVKEVAAALGRRKSISSAALIRYLCKQWDVACCVITLGENGAIAGSFSGEKFEKFTIVSEPGIAVDVLDTIGAGDAFAAGFIHNRLKNESLRSCLKLGNRLGALAASKPGGTAKFTNDELVSILS